MTIFEPGRPAFGRVGPALVLGLVLGSAPGLARAQVPPTAAPAEATPAAPTPAPAEATPTAEEAAAEKARVEASINRMMRLNAGQSLVRSERPDQRLEQRSLSLERETSSRFYEGMAGISLLASYISSIGPTTMVGVRVFGAAQLNVGYAFDKGGTYGLDILCISIRSVELTAGIYGVNGTGASPFRLSVPLYASFLPVKLPRARLHFIVDSPIFVDAFLKALDRGDTIRTSVLGYGFGVEWALL